MKNAVFVGLFGMLGACLRYLVGIGMKSWLDTPFPWGTLCINLTGSFTLSILTYYLVERFRIAERWRLAIGTGLIGAFTTFSTFSVETVELFQKALIGWAFAYLIMSLFGGLLFAWLGYAVSVRLKQMKEAGGVTE